MTGHVKPTFSCVFVPACLAANSVGTRIIFLSTTVRMGDYRLTVGLRQAFVGTLGDNSGSTGIYPALGDGEVSQTFGNPCTAESLATPSIKGGTTHSLTDCN